MRQTIYHHRVILINALVCTVISFPFGVVSGHLPGWLLAGLGAGVLLGALTDYGFRRLTENEQLRRRRLLLLVFVEALLAIYVVAPGYGAYQVVHPRQQPAAVTPADLGMAYEDVTLTTADGVALAAWYVPAQNGAAVIAVHPLQGNRTRTLYHVEALAAAGYGVLALDLRAHGESGGDRFAAGWTSDRDVQAAVEYLQKQAGIAPERIGALGLSVGANVIIYTAADHGSLHALWADGTGVGRVEDLLDPLPPEFRPLWFMTPVYWTYDRMLELLSGERARPPIKEEVKGVAPQPIHFVAAGEGWEQFQARKYRTGAGDTAILWELPAATHVSGITARPAAYRERMIAFFDRHLLAR